eukprot:gb/GFBE01062625.1/.p1 GENE.gb/GFBE01062625.1/~~gb/GFBE01062625.1/.p1  ORF type:complete len:236 (+),score=56.79 gb/GFBE01062625.1/:1-708(+)
MVLSLLLSVCCCCCLATGKELLLADVKERLVAEPDAVHPKKPGTAELGAVNDTSAEGLQALGEVGNASMNSTAALNESMAADEVAINNGVPGSSLQTLQSTGRASNASESKNASFGEVNLSGTNHSSSSNYSTAAARGHSPTIDGSEATVAGSANSSLPVASLGRTSISDSSVEVSAQGSSQSLRASSLWPVVWAVGVAASLTLLALIAGNLRKAKARRFNPPLTQAEVIGLSAV